MPEMAGTRGDITTHLALAKSYAEVYETKQIRNPKEIWQSYLHVKRLQTPEPKVRSPFGTLGEAHLGEALDNS